MSVANMYGVAVRKPGLGPVLESADPPVAAPVGNFGLIDLRAVGGRPEPGALMDAANNAQIASGANNRNETKVTAGNSGIRRFLRSSQRGVG